MEAIQKTRPAAPKQANLPDPGGRRRFSLLRMLCHQEMLLALCSGALMLAAWGINFWLPWLSVLLYVGAYVVGGFMKAREGLITLWKERDLDVNLLMIAAALGAACIGYWNEGAMLIFIFSFSGALESFASERSRKDISELIALKPETALKIDGGTVKEVGVETLVVGDLLLVKPGEIIPVDGLIRSGTSAVNQANITGESIPVDKQTGDDVYAGTVNGEGALYVETTSPAEGTLFAKIVNLVEQAQVEVPETQRFIKRVEGLYAKAVVAATVLLIVMFPLLFGWSWEDAFYKAMVFLVVASPCAIVASVMPAMLSAMSKSARVGVLFKGGAHMDNMGGTKVVAFDKTGTLTEGSPVVTELLVAAGFERLEVLSACAAAESLSEHPLARAIVSKAENEGIVVRSADELRALPGWGIEAVIEGRVWRVGKVNENDPSLPETLASHVRLLIEEGHTVSIVQCDESYAGIIGLRDEIRTEAKTVIEQLHKLGIMAAMLTGDRSGTARAVANQAGIDLVFGDLLPQNKVEHVKELRAQYGDVVMVGDGVNDAPALAAASVGVAMGVGGSGAALEVADVVLMNDSLERISSTIQLARRARRIVKENLIFAGAVIVLLIISNFVQGLPLPLGVVWHEGSTLLVILNGLRLLR